MGGKWRLAPWIISTFPHHRVYVEPFGGGASVLLRKPRAYGEVYNDLDGEVVNLFRVLRDDDMSARLIRQVELTPFARAEFAASYELTDEPVERARRLLVLGYQGFGGNAHARVSTGFRSNSNRSNTLPAGDWRNLPAAMVQITERLRGVVIENRDAMAVMEQHDGQNTLHYVDPPYIHSTRGRGNPYDVAYRGYAHEMTDADHIALLAFLKTLEGTVVLSGYPHEIYEAALDGWIRIQRKARADGARLRTEVLWINRVAPAPLFAEAARV
jgi:DNA adenine methylase